LKYFITLGIPDKLLLFLQMVSDGFDDLGKVWDEPMIIVSQSEKTADLMHSHWRLPIQHIPYLARIHGYSLWRYHVTQEWHFAQPELTLAVLDIELIIAQSLKHNAEVPLMLFLALRENQDVINEDRDKLVQLCHEYGVHQVHEVSGGVGQPEWHHKILIKTVLSGESSLRNVFLMDPELMITWSKINLWEHLCSNQLIE
jgi:hypothetical protein